LVAKINGKIKESLEEAIRRNFSSGPTNFQELERESGKGRKKRAEGQREV